MNITSTTSQELKVLRDSKYDLASGYPQYSIESWALNSRDFYHKAPLETTDLSVNTLSLSHTVGQSLVAFYNGKCAKNSRPLVLPSASIALQRVITELSACNAPALICSPVLDILPELAEEVTGKPCKFISDHSELTCCLQSASPYEYSMLLFAHPGNPVDCNWDFAQFAEIASMCSALSIPIIQDRCFSLLSLGSNNNFCISDFLVPGLTWAEIFDTGKIFDFGHEKFSVVLSDEKSYQGLKKRFEVVFFSMPKRSLIFWSMFLRSSFSQEYLDGVRILCKENQDHLTKVFEKIGVKVIASKTLTFLILENNYLNEKFPNVESILDKISIGYVQLPPFYQAGESFNGIRLSVARDSNYIHKLSKLVESVGCEIHET